MIQTTGGWLILFAMGAIIFVTLRWIVKKTQVIRKVTESTIKL